MWGFAMPMGIQNLLENIIQHLPQSNYAIFKVEIVTQSKIESSMLIEFHSIENWTLQNTAFQALQSFKVKKIYLEYVHLVP